MDNKTFTVEEKLKAAYALNLCTVSVSQIIDYSDINVLEQEYENILNNLNLEHMPHDEALLNILRQLLDTITFFRIQEGDKKFIDRDYQQKMKNAIWAAVPNIGLLVAGGDPITTAVSLASQIGIGYMNYRKAKAENALAYEEQMWRLQRTAIEQFNGLRRELFDTAWRLADKYQFPDEYRLTERQISQYNNILMDCDYIRKYERLNSIKDKFVAYPNFWYQFGNTANYIARDITLAISDDAREFYRNQAKEAFEKYWQTNKYNLLREDALASSCALEYVDLLDADDDRMKIEELLDYAVKMSGNANDCLQLCAIGYLKLGDSDKAMNLLSILVNESYNTVVNAQILSGLYVNKAITKQDIMARSKYEILRTRVNSEYLIRLPEISENTSCDELEAEFGEKQRSILGDKFHIVIKKYMNLYSIRMGKLIPPIEDKVYSDAYFADDYMDERFKEFNSLFEPVNKKKKAAYMEKLSHSAFLDSFFYNLNDFFGEICELNCIRDRSQLQEIIENSIIGVAEQINGIATKIEEKKILIDDINNMLFYTSASFLGDFQNELEKQINESISLMTGMAQYATTDSALRNFCYEHDIQEPDILLDEGENLDDTDIENKVYFSLNLLGADGRKIDNNQKLNRKIEKIIKNHMLDLKIISDKSDAYFHDSIEFNMFFENSKLKDHKDILQKTMAVYDDQSIFNADLLFTVDGVVPVVRNNIKELIPYVLLASAEERQNIRKLVSDVYLSDKKFQSAVIVSSIFGTNVSSIMTDSNRNERRQVGNILDKIQPMIDEITATLGDEFKKEIEEG